MVKQRSRADELKKGHTELLILAILEHRDRHGYQVGQEIASRSGGVLSYHAASLYPLLYRLEKRGWIVGRWVEKPGVRRRRYYRLTAAGKEELVRRRDGWKAFAAAINSVVGTENA